MSLFLVPLLMVAPHPPAEGDDIETIEVHGRAIELIGTAQAASEGVVGYADFKDRPLARVGELVEVIPGAVATQHSGEGKANQYFLRGFNLDHGTDFAVSVDGVPLNLRTHGHGQGYLDLNFIIPELVERVDYRKGPYAADNGDFSSAGSARYKTYDRLENSFVEMSIGEDGYARAVAGLDIELDNGASLLLGGEAQNYDGPWDLDQDLRKRNLYAKFSQRNSDMAYSLAASFYDNSWTSTDQVPSRAIDSGLIGRFGAIDEDLGGETERYSLSGTMSLFHEGGAETNFSAYLVGYDFNLWSNFTYFLEDEVNGDEFEQRDKRTYMGGSVTHQRPFGDIFTLKAGADIRNDDIDELGLYQTAGRERLTTIREDEVEELSLVGWVQLQTDLTPDLRLTVGLRGDYYDADVTALSLPDNSGSADDSMLTPSVALAWKASHHLEFYANYGQGFHSNDVRGATITVDPLSGEAAETVPILVRSEGAEIGARYQYGALTATVSGFWLELDSELVFVGDAGTTEASDGSERYGMEANLFWKLDDWLALDAAATVTDATYKVAGDDEIPGAVRTTFSAGAIGYFGPLTVSARLRHFGSAPLIEDGSVESDPTSIVNLGATYDLAPFTLELDVLNLFDADDADISYFYESRLPGETSGVEDIHYHPVQPRQVRAGLRYSF